MSRKSGPRVPLLLSGLLILLLQADGPPVAGQDVFPETGRFGLLLEGEGLTGFVKKVSGGDIRATIAVHNLGRVTVQKKRILAVFPQPFQIQADFSLTRGFFKWVEESFEEPETSRDGAIIASHPDIGMMNQRDFFDATITAIKFPAVDGNSVAECSMSIVIEPGEIVYAGGPPIAVEPPPDMKQWLCSNFRFELGDLPTSRVTKVDSFTWKLAVVKDEVGTFRTPTKHAAKIEVPNLKLTISAADLEPWQNWHRTFVINGQASDSEEKAGQITFLAPDLSDELGTLHLEHVGLISLESPIVAADTGEEEFQVTLYVEEMKLRVP